MPIHKMQFRLPKTQLHLLQSWAHFWVRDSFSIYQRSYTVQTFI